MSNQIFYVVNGRDRFSTPKAAVAFAVRSQYIDPRVKSYAIGALIDGKQITFSHGFTTVEIKPVRVDTYKEQQLSSIESADEFGYKLQLSSSQGKTNHLNITPEQFAKIKQLLVYSGEVK